MGSPVSLRESGRTDARVVTKYDRGAAAWVAMDCTIRNRFQFFRATPNRFGNRCAPRAIVVSTRSHGVPAYEAAWAALTDGDVVPRDARRGRVACIRAGPERSGDGPPHRAAKGRRGGVEAKSPKAAQPAPSIEDETSEGLYDTIGVRGLDADGNLSGAWTPSGTAGTIPGRVGDSSLI